MPLTTPQRLRFGLLALLAVLIATPGVHVAERWLARPAAIWVSHGLALGLLAVVLWRWWVARRRDAAVTGQAA
jgi:hypothetical protein